MAEIPLQLDWRHGPITAEVLHRIHQLLDEISLTSSAQIILSGSLAGKPGAQLCLVDKWGSIVEEQGEDTRRMFLFKLKSIKKKSVEYLLRLSVVAARVAEDIDKGVPVASRLFGYYWANSLIDSKSAISLATDLALTIRVHPYVLGILPEVDGRISVPAGWTIQAKVCTNIFGYLDKDPASVEVQTFKGPVMGSKIPSLVVSLSVIKNRPSSDDLRAVIVLEHKNIHYMLEAQVRRHNPEFKGIFFVQTGGFSDRGTREFLRLLTRDKVFRRVPCIFVSDRDPHAMEIFSNLKYGSRACAYESYITAVNQIQWGGVSIEHYERLAKEWPARALEEWVTYNPGSSQEDRDKWLAAFKQRTQRSMIEFLKKPEAQLNKSDKARMKHFHKLGVFSDEYDAKLYADVRAMGMNALGSREAVSAQAPGKKFAFAKLNHLNPYGIEECLVAVIKEFGVIVNQDPVGSHLPLPLARRVWQAAGAEIVHDVAHVDEEMVDEAVDASLEEPANALAEETTAEMEEEEVVVANASTNDVATHRDLTTSQNQRSSRGFQAYVDYTRW